MTSSAEIFEFSKFNIPSMEKLYSTVKRKTRSSTSSNDSSRSPEDKRQKDSSNSEETILETFNMAEDLAEKVDLILSKLSKLEKLDAIELRLNNLATAVSSIEESVSKLERDVSVLESKFKNTDHSVSELKESPNFCEERRFLKSRKTLTT